MNKIITILEARVNEQKWDTLQNAYRAVKESSQSPMPRQSFLAQMKEEPTLWQIISVWESMEVLQKMRSSGETPAGVLVFREANAEPKLSIFEAKEEI
ncbi:MAG: hypothetical protein HYW51_00010 [Candidatus Doudnabacteria bacterium]|nr:hypothetical protein [Candidatus Doudnabacteria bacterium]